MAMSKKDNGLMGKAKKSGAMPGLRDRIAAHCKEEADAPAKPDGSKAAASLRQKLAARKSKSK